MGGDHVKQFYLLRHLAKNHNVTFITSDAEHCSTKKNIAELKKLGIEIIVENFSVFKALLRTFCGIFSRKPLEICFYKNTPTKKKIKKILSEKKFNVAIAFFLRCAEFLSETASPHKILIAEDSRYLLESRATKKFSFSPEYFVRLLDKVRLKNYEPRLMEKFSAVTFVSPSDKNDVLERNPNIPATILANGVALDDFPFFAAQKNRSGILFCGRMDIHHNIATAERLIKNIMPLVREKFPSITLTIVGAYPRARIKKFASQNVVVTGYVSDVKKYFANAAVFAHPQAVGAGIQNKLLEAMALGTASVSTPIGISGIGAQNGKHVVLAESDAEFADRICELVTNEKLRASLTYNARNHIEEHFSWENVLAPLDDILHHITT